MKKNKKKKNKSRSKKRLKKQTIQKIELKQVVEINENHSPRLNAKNRLINTIYNNRKRA